MTTAHKNLTGTDLHEVKGASTATSGQVPIADGLGGAPFGSFPDPFSHRLLHVNEQQPGLGTSTSSALSTFVTTALNNVLTNEISGASLASNQITLPAGTYFLDAKIPFAVSSGAGGGWYLKPRLFNISTSTVLVDGAPFNMYGVSSGGGFATVRGRFTLVAVNVLTLQHYKTNGNAGQGNGFNPEIYAEALIWKVA